MLPWFSLLVSLPAMMTVQAGLRCPETVGMGVPAKTALQISCRFPAPPIHCRIKLYHHLTGSSYIGKPGERIPTEHCGCMRISCNRLFATDYLGLFRRRLHNDGAVCVYIHPKAVPCSLPEHLYGQAVSLWKPKSGGGFSENHELRPYRPGDDLRSIHWKMTAKTGKLIYREPIVPLQEGCLLSLTLCGDAHILDKKLGQLSWLNHTLLQRHCAHEVQCHTADGIVRYRVDSRRAAEEGLNTLLCSRAAQGEFVPTPFPGQQQYRIGGDGNEA